MMTEREQKVMDLYDRAFSSGQIALLLDIKPATVLRIIGLYAEGDDSFSAMVVKGSRKLSSAIQTKHPEQLKITVDASLTPEEQIVWDMRIRSASVAHMARCLNVSRHRIKAILSRLPGVEQARHAHDKQGSRMRRAKCNLRLRA